MFNWGALGARPALADARQVQQPSKHGSGFRVWGGVAPGLVS